MGLPHSSPILLPCLLTIRFLHSLLLDPLFKAIAQQVENHILYVGIVPLECNSNIAVTNFLMYLFLLVQAIPSSALQYLNFQIS